jgi:hypothetical protein
MTEGRWRSLHSIVLVVAIGEDIPRRSQERLALTVSSVLQLEKQLPLQVLTW